MILKDQPPPCKEETKDLKNVKKEAPMNVKKEAPMNVKKEEPMNVKKEAPMNVKKEEPRASSSEHRRPPAVPRVKKEEPKRELKSEVIDIVEDENIVEDIVKAKSQAHTARTKEDEDGRPLFWCDQCNRGWRTSAAFIKHQESAKLREQMLKEERQEHLKREDGYPPSPEGAFQPKRRRA